MKLPNFKRLIKSDYAQEFHSLIETIGFSVNNGVEVLYQALNKSLSLKDNIACTVKELTVEVKDDGTPKTQLTFTLDTSNRILGITVLNASNLTNPTVYPSFMPFISYTQSGKNVTINNIKGLQSGQKYTLTIVAFDN